MTPDAVAKVLAAGASLKINRMTPDALERLAAIAKRAGVQLEIKGRLTPDAMVRVALAGKGHVFFDTTE